MLDLARANQLFQSPLDPKIAMSKIAVKREVTRRSRALRVAERAFVKQVLERKVTAEVEEFTAAASRRSHQVRTAAFLDRFRKQPIAA